MHMAHENLTSSWVAANYNMPGTVPANQSASAPCPIVYIPLVDLRVYILIYTRNIKLRLATREQQLVSDQASQLGNTFDIDKSGFNVVAGLVFRGCIKYCSTPVLGFGIMAPGRSGWHEQRTSCLYLRELSPPEAPP